MDMPREVLKSLYVYNGVYNGSAFIKVVLK